LTQHLPASGVERRIEVAVLDRGASGTSKFRPLTANEVSDLIGPGWARPFTDEASMNTHLLRCCCAPILTHALSTLRSGARGALHLTHS
jgi:hypothetical protein